MNNKTFWFFATLTILVAVSSLYSIVMEKKSFQDDLPDGDLLNDCKIEKILSVSCETNEQCETPSEYLLQSRCPFTTLCLDKTCVVVCPLVQD